ncbi:hypothetical protein Plhal703r1_c54g0159621 [Plasmopara halstedii]
MKMRNLFLLLVIAAFVVSNGIASLAATDSNKARSLKAAENEVEVVTHALDGKRFLMQTENVKVSGSLKGKIAAKWSEFGGAFKKWWISIKKFFGFKEKKKSKLQNAKDKVVKSSASGWKKVKKASGNAKSKVTHTASQTKKKIGDAADAAFVPLSFLAEAAVSIARRLSLREKSAN